ncbi:MAG: phage/plasmid primase, P4 family [Bacteroidetes bacterium]|nr:phage/plasmid primase, P4 family [Bacteroidota bacterium]
MPLDIENWDKHISRCKLISDIDHKLHEHQKPTDEELKKLVIFASTFGAQGKKQLLFKALYADIDSKIINDFWAEVETENYDVYNLCPLLCGKQNVCKLIKIFKKDSPFALPTESYYEFQESYAVSLIEKYYGNDIIFHMETQRFYEYNNGVWTHLDEDKLNMLIETLLMETHQPEYVKVSEIHSLVKRLKCRSRLSFEGNFNNDKFILNLKNGLFDLRTFTLLPHNKSYKTNVQFPIEYDANASCKLFEEKLFEIFDGNEVVVDHFLNWMMYTLLPTYEHEKALLLYGKGGNGKSVLMDVWGRLIGTKNISNQELSDLASDRNYSVYQLVNKYANFSKEVSTLEKESNIFKSLTGNDVMPARQIREKPMEFRNIARLIMSANQLPKFKVVDTAIIRRFDIIKFEKRFDGIADTQLNIKLRKELPGILNLVLSKAKNIIHPDGSVHFETPSIIEQNLNLFNETSTSTAEFVNDMCKLSSIEKMEYATTLKAMYDAYVAWCKNTQGVAPKNRSVFKDELDSLFSCKTRQIPSLKADSGVVHKNINWVQGIRLLSEDLGVIASVKTPSNKLVVDTVQLSDKSKIQDEEESFVLDEF